jgi:hypothetical protein
MRRCDDDEFRGADHGDDVRLVRCPVDVSSRIFSARITEVCQSRLSGNEDHRCDDARSDPDAETRAEPPTRRGAISRGQIHFVVAVLPAINYDMAESLLG